MSELAELSTRPVSQATYNEIHGLLLVLRESTLTHGPKKATRNNELTSMPPEQIGSNRSVSPSLERFRKKSCAMLCQVICLAVERQLLELHG